MNLIDKFINQKRIENISNAIEELIPEGGQFPFVLFHQIRVRFPKDDIDWLDMRIAFNYLIEQTKIFPDQDLSHSIIKKVYKIGYSPQQVHC